MSACTRARPQVLLFLEMHSGQRSNTLPKKTNLWYVTPTESDFLICGGFDS